MDERILFWFSGFEKGVAAMEPQQREAFFYECGKNCVKQGTLDFYRELYDSAAGNLDIFFQKVNEVPGLRAKVLAPGHQYEFCFADCSCMLHTQGYVNTPQLCECSRQSVRFVLETLWPDKNFSVELTASILRGGDMCRLTVRAQDGEA